MSKRDPGPGALEGPGASSEQEMFAYSRNNVSGQMIVGSPSVFVVVVG